MVTIYFLHVLLAFAAIAFLVIPGLMLEMVGRTKDVPLIKRMYRLGQFHGKIGGPVALLTAAVGFIVAWRNGVPLGARWLVVAYIAFVLVIVLGIGYHSRREIRIGALAEASPESPPSAELVAATDDPLATPMLWVSGILWVFIIWLMVAKPF